MTPKPFCTRAVLFDFDGTLTHPGALDFRVIREKLGCPQGTAILEYIESLPEARERRRLMAELDRLETEGAKASRPNPGAEALILDLKSRKIKVGVISRNSRPSIDTALANFERIRADHFDVIISRDDPVAPKPLPDGIFLAAERFGVPAREIVVVGDFIFDIQAGNRAGSTTVFLTNGGGQVHSESDFTIASLSELEAILEWGRPLKAGKLPQPLLEKFLADTAIHADPSVLIRPGIGEDTAAVDLGGSEVLVLTSDPITFATDAIGQYAVVVNANDMATSGAVPRWLMTTLLFPPGATPSLVAHTMGELARSCRALNITLCGGHTEITDAVRRPVVVGTLSGTVSRDRLISKRDMAPGDCLLVTKGVSVEGTAIIAREFGQRLVKLGMPEAAVDGCRQFLDRISVVPEAGIAAANPEVCALHDVTEGGIASAVEELSIAGGRGIRVRLEAIPVFPETERICRLLDLDPMGLIGSGSLLICCRESARERLAADLKAAGIAVSAIGEVVDAPPGVRATRHGRTVPWPRFEVDEITRLF